MREVTGYLTDDGAFYETEEDAEKHEATYSLVGAFSQYVGKTGNIERFQNVIINLAPEIRRYLNAVEGAEPRQSETVSEVEQATVERETRHRPRKVDIHTPNDGLGSALEGLEQQPDRGHVHVSDVGHRTRTETLFERSTFDGT